MTRLPYGDSFLDFEVDCGEYLDTLDIISKPDTAPVNISTALNTPIGTARPLRETVKPGETVTIVVSDSFRKTRIELVLPTMLAELAAAGVREEDIQFLYATGSHRPPTPSEQEAILGADVYARFRERAFAHDPNDTANLRFMGETRRSTPVWINRRALECDRLIVTGTVVLHYFGGFGGGRKAILPGLSGIATIAANHAMNLHPTEDAIDPAVRIGVLDGNPVAEDMLEGARFVKTDFLVNTVLDERGAIAGLFAGELDAAHRAAAAFAASLYAIPIQEKVDIVIAASGPTRNFVQTHKALYNAWQAVKPGGRIILAAQCEEGLGGEQFVKWLRLGSPEAVIAGLRRNSEINGQTALSTLGKGPITIMITGMDAAQVAMLGARKADGMPEALAMAREELGANATWRFMPRAAYTVPMIHENINDPDS